MHDAVARRDDVHVLERGFGPVDEVKTIVIAPIFNFTIFIKGVGIKARMFDGERVIDDELGWHYRVDARRVTALLGDGVAQSGEIDERGLAENVVADHACRVPRKVEIATALDYLPQRGFQIGNSEYHCVTPLPDI